MRTRKTHFEQVPIEVVKKIAQPIQADQMVPPTLKTEESILSAAYPWQEQYFAAALETDTKKMKMRIQAAKAAIDARLLDLQLDHGGTPEERNAIGHALRAMTVLQKEITTWPYDTGLSEA
jgi:hypothetical protein